MSSVTAVEAILNLICLPVLKAFKEYGKIVEVNDVTLRGPESARSRCAQILKLCKQLEIPVVVNQ